VAYVVRFENKNTFFYFLKKRYNCNDGIVAVNFEVVGLGPEGGSYKTESRRSSEYEPDIG
jgi:hypothetical protein